jgi:aspartokinase
MVDSFGVAAEIFSRMAKNRISVDAIATSQTSISFTIDQSHSLRASQALEALSLERPDVVGVFKVTDDQAMVSIVGGGLSPRAMSKAMLCLYRGGVPIKMTSYGASKISFSTVTDAGHERAAVSALYSAFFSPSGRREQKEEKGSSAEGKATKGSAKDAGWKKFVSSTGDFV